MIYLTINTILMILVLMFVLLMLYKTRQHRENAELILQVRPPLKILIPLLSTVLVVVNLPHSLYILGYALALVFVPFSLDIVVEGSGVYFGLKFTPWNRIETISDHPAYLMIETKRKLQRKGFLKIIWKIRTDDVKRIQSLFAASNPPEKVEMLRAT